MKNAGIDKYGNLNKNNVVLDKKTPIYDAKQLNI